MYQFPSRRHYYLLCVASLVVEPCTQIGLVVDLVVQPAGSVVMVYVGDLLTSFLAIMGAKRLVTDRNFRIICRRVNMDVCTQFPVIFEKEVSIVDNLLLELEDPQHVALASNKWLRFPSKISSAITRHVDALNLTQKERLIRIPDIHDIATYISIERGHLQWVKGNTSSIFQVISANARQCVCTTCM